MYHITITLHVYEQEFISGIEVGWWRNDSRAVIRDGVSTFVSMKTLDIFKEILGNFGIFLTRGQVVCVFFNEVLGYFKLCLWPKCDLFPTPAQWFLSLKLTRQTPVYKTVFQQLCIWNNWIFLTRRQNIFQPCLCQQNWMCLTGEEGISILVCRMKKDLFLTLAQLFLPKPNQTWHMIANWT